MSAEALLQFHVIVVIIVSLHLLTACYLVVKWLEKKGWLQRRNT